MFNHLFNRVGLIALILLFCPSRNVFSAEEPVACALLFYSPSCPHCYKVITEDLPPILEKYGDQILILGVNTHTEKGNDLFLTAIGYFNIPQEMAGVPMLVIGETALIGSVEIPQRLPGIIATGLASGGIDWPRIPGLDQLLEDEISFESDENEPKAQLVEENSETEMQESVSKTGDNQNEIKEVAENQKEQSLDVARNVSESIATTENMTIAERFLQDRIGNSISTLVLIGMIFSVLLSGIFVSRSDHILRQWPNWFVSILLVIGSSVAIYMAYVEITHLDAVCGPVGDCNTVQQSSFASLFGIIPIGLLGVVGYFIIGIVWLVSIFGRKLWRNVSLIILWGLSLFGTLFSVYLTFLEPFVIGATCAWCLTSAVVMTLLFWNSTANIQQIGGINQLIKICKNQWSQLK